MVECFDERLVGQVSFLFISCTVECDHPGSCRFPQKFSGQTRFANARFSCEEKHSSTPLPGGAQPCLEGFKFTLASDQWRIFLSLRDYLHRCHTDGVLGCRKREKFAVDKR